MLTSGSTHFFGMQAGIPILKLMRKINNPYLRQDDLTT